MLHSISPARSRSEGCSQQLQIDLTVHFVKTGIPELKDRMYVENSRQLGWLKKRLREIASPITQYLCLLLFNFQQTPLRRP